MGFQYADDARRMLAAPQGADGEVSADAKRGKDPSDRIRPVAGARSPTAGPAAVATFAFLGFTHYCGRTRDGRFVVKRKTQSKRLTVKAQSASGQARRRMHAPVAEQHRWLCQVLRGHYAYYGLPGNFQVLNSLTSTGSATLVPLASTAESAAADLGRLRRAATAFLPPDPTNHASRARSGEPNAGSPSGRAVCGKAARTDL